MRNSRELHYATVRVLVLNLPSSRVVFAQAGTIVIVPTRLVIIIIHVYLVRILLEVGHIVSSVSPLEDRVGSLGLLFAFPEEVLAKTNSQLGGEHISSSGSWGESELMWSAIGGSDDRLSLRAWDFCDWLEALLHHEGMTVFRFW
jgi:hypothetical protein